MTAHFTPATFAFLRDLADHNDRDWFKANQDRFEEEVRGPALDFIEAFAEPLYAISPHFAAEARKVGGSLFRIQRDTRFSKDKTPYKTQVGIHFRHVATRDDVHAPGFYLHLEPRNCFAGVGLWRPSTENAGKIRDRIDRDRDGWRRAAYAPRFLDLYTFGGESLKRPPKGYPADHPFVEDLMRKDFIASAAVTQARVTSDDFLKSYRVMCTTAAPFMRFLCGALDLAF